MKKKLIFTFIVFSFSLGIMGIAFMPFTNPDSPLYTESLDKIATQIVVTQEAAAFFCEQDVCVLVRNCEDSLDQRGCDMIDTELCETYNCTFE